MRADIWLGMVTVFMAVLGGIVSAHAPTKTWHKIAYVSAFVLAGAASIWLVIRISNENAAANIELATAIKNLNNSTTSIASMTALNTQLQGKLLQQGETIAALSKENIAAVTGGSSYPYFEPNILATAMDGTIRIEGRYPVQELVVVVDDVTEMFEGENLSDETIRALSKDEIAPFRVPFKYATGFSFPFISPGTFTPIPSPIPFSGKGERHLYHVTFNARNGRWSERILLKKDKYHYRWRIAYQVYKGDFIAGQSLIKTWVEPVFPLLDNGKPDLR